jgi:hypothetical protein
MTIRPGRDLIRVQFAANTDLGKLAGQGDSLVFVHSYFCDRGNTHLDLGGPGVFMKWVDRNSESSIDSARLEYLFFIDVARKAGPNSVPPEGFDLSVKPEDVCFYVTAHGVITTYTSSIARIPKAAIAQLFTGKTRD